MWLQNLIFLKRLKETYLYICIQDMDYIEVRFLHCVKMVIISNGDVAIVPIPEMVTCMTKV